LERLRELEAEVVIGRVADEHSGFGLSGSAKALLAPGREVALAPVKEVADAASAPRMLYLRWPFGHALGEPGNVAQQRTNLHDMLFHSESRVTAWAGD
jgi:hypothetical protein